MAVAALALACAEFGHESSPDATVQKSRLLKP
jgi:hypothetical protein